MTTASSRRTLRRWFGVGLVGLLAGCSGVNAGPGDSAASDPTTTDGGVAQLRVEVLETYPHDPEAFTQGLELHQGQLYEGTGLYGESDIRIVEPETGEVLRQEDLPDTAFGEGLTLAGDQIWQLTWREGIAFRRDPVTLAEREQVSYTGEGWGLCYDSGEDRLVMSDGTPQLTFRDPETFEPTGTVDVTREGQPLSQINELECVDGRVWANIWQTDEIVRIDPQAGVVDAVVDASGLLTSEEEAAADVLNGIAAAPDLGNGSSGGTFLITGKLWPKLFKVQFVPA